jgi:hypothetical protein
MERELCISWITGWMNSKAGVDIATKRKITASA